jgi:hypothetical protein
MTKREVLKYTGDYNQLFGVTPYTLTNGRANGVRAIRVKNGAGLEFTVLPDRCLDIADLSFEGVNCGYLSKTGIVSPEYYEKDGNGFLRNFFAGFLTTCGLRNVGPTCLDGSETFTQHGRIANIAGEDVYASVEWEEDTPEIVIKGSMREATVFGENLMLHRKITCRIGENKIHIHNRVENAGFRNEQILLLFHFNMGYPLLNENSRLIIPSAGLLPRDSDAEAGRDIWHLCQKPTPGYREQVFCHDLKTDADGNTYAVIVNDELDFGLDIRFNKKQLFNFTQWKQMGEGEYVMGLEPCNCQIEGRTHPHVAETPDILEPGETRDFDVIVELLKGKNSFKTL